MSSLSSCSGRGISFLRYHLRVSRVALCHHRHHGRRRRVHLVRSGRGLVCRRKFFHQRGRCTRGLHQDVHLRHRQPLLCFLLGSLRVLVIPRCGRHQLRHCQSWGRFLGLCPCYQLFPEPGRAVLYGVMRACSIGSRCARALDAYMNGALKIVYHQANKKDAPELAMAISPEARPSGFSIRTPNRMICSGTYRDVLSIGILVATAGSVKRFWWWVSCCGCLL